MCKQLTILVCAILCFSCSKNPKGNFIKDVLAEKITTTNDSTITFKDIYKANDGKITVVDFWASWCPDCIKALGSVKEIQQIYAGKNVRFVFLSVDEDAEAWKRGIEKNHIEGNHYRIIDKWKKSKLCDYIELSWIPRYMVLDAEGNILHYNSEQITDKALIAILEKGIPIK